MPRLFALFAASIVLAIGWAGCATERPVVVNYDASQNETTYRSPSIRIPIEVQGSGYGSQFNQLRMLLQAECSGRDCQPSMATMTLSTGGSSDLYLGDRTLLIRADAERFEWPDPKGNREEVPERIVGMIARLTIDVSQLRAMATAEELSGTIGSVILEFGDRSQQRLREYLTRMGVELPAAEA